MIRRSVAGDPKRISGPESTVRNVVSFLAVFKFALLILLFVVIPTAMGDDRVRLEGGIDQYQGRVEVFHNGSWGTVCDDGFNTGACEVVCRELGHSGGVCIAKRTDTNGCTEKSAQLFADGSEMIWLDEVTCTGNEQSLIECRHGNWGDSDCLHKEDVGCICTAVPSPEVTTESLPVTADMQPMRDDAVVDAFDKQEHDDDDSFDLPSGAQLVSCDGDELRLLPFGGSIDKDAEDGFGLVAVKSTSDDTWGLVCDDTWDDETAGHVCSCLGFNSSSASRAIYNVHHTSKLPIISSGIRCVTVEYVYNNETLTTLSRCGTLPVNGRSCDPATEAAAIACVPPPSDNPLAVHASLNCSENMMTACLERNESLAALKTSLSPECATAAPVTTKSSVCYSIDMTTCDSVAADTSDWAHVRYCYDIIYEDSAGFVASVTSGLGEAVGLRIQSASTKHRFCCNIPAVSKAVVASFQLLNGHPPPMHKEQPAVNFSMSCFPNVVSSPSAADEPMSFPVVVQSGAEVYCRTVVHDVWDHRLQLVVPNCTFSTAPSGGDASYQFIVNNCPTRKLLNVQFVSVSRLSVGFRTRIPKFDGHAEVYMTCVARLCNPNPKDDSCDRSCNQQFGLPPKPTSADRLFRRESPRVVETSTTELPPFPHVKRSVVRQGPFVVSDSDSGLTIGADGQMSDALHAAVRDWKPLVANTAGRPLSSWYLSLTFLFVLPFLVIW